MIKTNGCKVCNSKLRLDLEIEKLVHGKSYRELETYAKQEGFEITHSYLHKHFTEHVDEKREIQVRYLAEKREDTEKDTDEVAVKIKELRELDTSIKSAASLRDLAEVEIKRQLKLRIPYQRKLKDANGNETGEIMQYEKVEVSHSVVTLYKGVVEEIRQTMKVKNEILGIDKKKVGTKDAVDTLVDMLMKLEEE